MTGTRKWIPKQQNVADATDQKTDEELLAMMPEKDADPATWRAYHQMLFDAGKLTPPDRDKKR